MTLRVLWRSDTGSKAAAQLSDALRPEIDITVETDASKAEALETSFDVLVDGSPGEALLERAGLKHVIVPYVGINKTLQAQMRARPHLTLHNAHFNDAFVAQHAVALMLACTNRVVEASNAMHDKDWHIRYDPTGNSLFLGGKTCLLLGYGAIGKELRPRLEGLGMTVTGYKRTPDPDAPIKLYTPESLQAALAEADVIICSLPSTPATLNLLDKDAFASMKQDAVLVNVGRADVIDQHALYEALTSKKLFAAALDVWWHYPEEKDARRNTQPADAMLHTLPNLIMSPHRANQVHEWQTASYQDVVKTLKALTEGHLRSVVNPEQGY